MGGEALGKDPKAPEEGEEKPQEPMFRGYPGLRNLRVTPRSLYGSFLSYVGVTFPLLS